MGDKINILKIEQIIDKNKQALTDILSFPYTHMSLQFLYPKYQELRNYWDLVSSKLEIKCKNRPILLIQFSRLVFPACERNVR
jgi:hypothetical protein